MKALKIIVGIIIALIAIAALVLVLALTPAIQTWAVHKALANQPGMKAAHVAVGLNAADLQDVHYVANGLSVTATRVRAKYSAWDFLAHRKINVDDLTVDGLVVDTRASAVPAATASHPTNAGESSPPAQPAANGGSPQPTPAQPFNGILNQIKLPYDVRIARFSVPGRALLPNDQTATFTLNGSDIGTGQRGTIDWTADLANAAANAPFRTAHTAGTATVHITTERRIDLLNVNALARVEGPNLPSDQMKLDAKAEQPAAGGNEGYNVTVTLMHGTTTEPLLTIAAQYDASAHAITGAWNLNVRTEQVGALLNGLGLPDITANGAGHFSTRPATGAVTANGELQADLAHLEKISPDLQPVGTLHIEAQFDGGLQDNVAHLQQFGLTATEANGQQLARITALQPIGYSLANQRVSFTNARAQLARISLQRLPLAWAQPFAKQLTIESGDLSLVLAVAADTDGSHVRVAPLEPLVVRNLTVRKGSQTLARQMNLTVKPLADYGPDRLHAELSDLSVSSATGDTVNGSFTVDVTNLSKTPHIAFTTDTHAKFIELLKPYLKVETGPLVVATKSAGTAEGSTLHFDSSATRITRPSGELVAAIDLEQPVTLDTQKNTVTTAKAGETLRVNLGQIPLAWAQGLVANSALSGNVAGGAIGVTVRSMDDMTANTLQPVTLRGVSVTMSQQPMLRDVDLAVDFTATKHGNAVTYDVRKVDARQGSASLLALNVAGDAALGAKLAVTAKGRLTSDLGALMQQPAVSGKAGLERGNLDATFDVKLTDTVQAQATITARNLVAKENHQQLGNAELQLTAAVQPDGSSVVKMPFTLTNGQRKSDLLLDGKLARAGNAITFDGRVTSNRLIIDDLKPLAGLAPSSNPAAGTSTGRPAIPAVSSTGAPPPPSPAAGAPGAVGPQPSAAAGSAAATTARDTVPFWSAFGGNIQVDLKQIDYGQDYAITAVRGNATITPTKLAVPALQGNFKNNPFQLAATIDFSAAQPQPYALNATATVSKFDVGAFLKAANPNQPPQLETIVTLNAKVNGKGGNLDDLAQHASGTFDLNGSKGVLRALGQKGGMAANVGSAVLGFLGARNNSDTASALGQLAGKLAELPFDKFDMHVERGPDLNLKVSRIEFTSADTHVLGSGEIRNQPGVPIQNQPMQFTLQLGGKQDMAFLLNRLHALNGKQDAQGYYTMSDTFTLGGTPSNPDSSALWKFLAQLGTQALAPSLLKMFGK